MFSLVGSVAWAQFGPAQLHLVDDQCAVLATVVTGSVSHAVDPFKNYLIGYRCPGCVDARTNPEGFWGVTSIIMYTTRTIFNPATGETTVEGPTPIPGLGGGECPNIPDFSFASTQVPEHHTLRVDLETRSLLPGATSEVVSTGSLSLSPETAPVNNPPVAVIAPIGPVHPGIPVVLDGTGSTDPDLGAGDMIASYRWVIGRQSPPGIVGNLNGPLTSFAFPTQGVYRVTLIVTDTQGLEGTVQVEVSTFNTPPVADAGIDINLTTPTSVVLPCYTPPCDVPQGNRSSDPDGDELESAWVHIDAAGQETTVSNEPTISPPINETTRYRLIVHDPFGGSHFDEVLISFNPNRPPRALWSLGESIVEVGEAIQLDGSHSTDPDGDPLTYRWGMVSVPTGSAAMLDDLTSVRPSFFADVAGTYVITLTVNDGKLDSLPATQPVTVVVLLDQATTRLQEVIALISGLDSSEFKKKDQRTKLINQINVAILEMSAGNLTDALEILRTQVYSRIDGCRAASQAGNQPAPENDDWLVNCTTQSVVSSRLNLGYGSLSFMIDDGESGVHSPAVDVKPGTAGNPINPVKDEEVALAVLSSSSFYAPLMWLPQDRNQPRVSVGITGIGNTRAFEPKTKDVNNDGFLDLVVKFHPADAGVVCGGSTQLTVVGSGVALVMESTVPITLKGSK
jgi:PKD domain